MPSQSQDSPLPIAEVSKTSPKTILPLWQVEKNAILEAIIATVEAHKIFFMIYLYP